MIERAASKLRLDQLVIQQGRVSQQAKTLSKNELVNMIKHGAETILKSTVPNLQDTSIESILLKGEKRTAELDAKFRTLGLDALQKFSLEGF